MFNLSTLSGINLQTDNYFQYTSVKRTCVFSKMYLRFGENAKAFDMKHFGVLKFITILVKRNIKDLKCSDLWRRQRLYVF